MSTFVIRFLRETSEAYRGHVRHVGSGEEVAFSCQKELYSFIDEMRVLNGVIGARDDPPDSENRQARADNETDS